MKRVRKVEELEETIVGEVQELTTEAQPPYIALQMMLAAADLLHGASELLQERYDFDDPDDT